MNKIDIEKFKEQHKPKPSKYLDIFKSYGIPQVALANYLGRSYPYISLVLRGYATLSPAVEKKLKQLVDQLQESE